MDWFVSDTHFGHANIIKYCNRPFRTAGEMDKVILDNINAVVRPDDTLWHGGDFSFGRGTSPQTIEFTRRQILCKNIRLIVGNHDRLITGSKELKSLFTEVLNYYLGEIGGRRFLITHRPPAKAYNSNDWNWEKTLWDREQAKDPNLVCLHGHTHNSSCLGPSNICVEITGYKPVSLPDVLKRFPIRAELTDEKPA